MELPSQGAGGTDGTRWSSRDEIMLSEQPAKAPATATAMAKASNKRANGRMGESGSRRNARGRRYCDTSV
jgi:hypothetical protein